MKTEPGWRSRCTEQLQDVRSGVRIPVRSRLLEKVQTAPRGHSAKYTMNTVVLYRGKLGQEVKSFTHFSTVQITGISGVVPLFSLLAFMVWNASVILKEHLSGFFPWDLPVVKISPEWVTGPERGTSSGRIANFSLWTGMFRDGISCIADETVIYRCDWVVISSFVRTGYTTRRWGWLLGKGKGKAVPLQACSGPGGSRKLRFPDFMTTAQDGDKVVSFTHRPPLPPGNIPGTHFC